MVYSLFLLALVPTPAVNLPSVGLCLPSQSHLPASLTCFPPHRSWRVSSPPPGTAPDPRPLLPTGRSRILPGSGLRAYGVSPPVVDAGLPGFPSSIVASACGPSLASCWPAALFYRHLRAFPSGQCGLSPSSPPTMSECFNNDKGILGWIWDICFR